MKTTKSQPLHTIAGGGLIDRRSFLLSGLAMGSAIPLLAHAGTGLQTTSMPPWMQSPGGPDSHYGSPSTYESHVQRMQAKNHPETALFSVWHSPIQHQRGVITPSGLHYGVHHNGIPDISPDKHQLLIHGLVDKPLKFSVDALLRYPMVSRIHFLECAGNTAPNAVSLTPLDEDCQELFGQVSGSEWTGIPIKTLLHEANLKSNAKWVIAEGADGGSQARSLPLQQLMEHGMLALYQNGERLRPSQGYPMRLFIPGWEGNANIKWLHRLEVSDQPALTKDESGLYSDILANKDIRRFSLHMEVKSVITHPSGKQLLPEKKGFYEISGLAWSGRGKIKQVEVSADGGQTWANAHLQEPVLDRSLTRFSLPWQWSGKSSLLLSRATDEYGNVQPTRQTWKNKFASYSFNHYNAIQAWRVHDDGLVENTYV